MPRNPALSPELLRRRALLVMGFLQQTQPPWKSRVCSDQPETCRSAQKNIPAGTPKARRRSRLGRRGSGIRELTSNCNNIISLLGRKSTREKMPETDARGVVSMCLRARAACFTTLTGGNKTTHSRKSTLRPGGGRQGRREETARGSNEVFCSKRPSLRTDSSHSGCLGSWCMKRQFQDGLVV